MVVRGVVKKGEYYDSVSLMNVARKITSIKGVIDCAVVMGTKENLSILETSGLLIDDIKKAADTDLLIVIKAGEQSIIDRALGKVDEHLKSLRDKSESSEELYPRSIGGALDVLPKSNLALISLAGKYAGGEAMKALKAGLHVMLFSDNVPIETEIELKKFAAKKGLFVMGPDCGTAIINGVPLAFANVI